MFQAHLQSRHRQSLPRRSERVLRLPFLHTPQLQRHKAGRLHLLLLHHLQLRLLVESQLANRDSLLMYPGEYPRTKVTSKSRSMKATMTLTLLQTLVTKTL